MFVPFNCFKHGFNCTADMNILILVVKQKTLKATDTVICFSCTFFHGPRFTVTSLMQRSYLKKSLKESKFAISSNLDRSNLQNFSTWCQPWWFLVGLSDMVVFLGPRGSLNSWNHWINDRPLYRSLFSPLEGDLLFGEPSFLGFLWVF